MSVFRAHVTRVYVSVVRLAPGSRHALAVAVAMLLQSSTPASAQTPNSRIFLDAQLPDRLQRCVSAERLQASYDRLQAGTHAELASAPQPSDALRVELRTSGEAKSDVTQIELRAFRGEHSLGVRVLPVRARDCAAMPNTLALVVQLLARSETSEPTVQPPAASRVPQGTAAEAAVPPVAAPPQAEPPPQLRAAEQFGARKAPRDEQVAWGAGLGIGASFGALPHPATTLQLSAALRLSTVELRLRAAVLWPQERAIAEGSVRMSTYELALEACPTAHLDRSWALRLCVGPRLGIVRAESRGFAVRNRDANEFSLYFGALPELAFGLSGTTWLQLSAGVALALQRPKFALQFQDRDSPFVLDGPQVLRGEINLSLVQIL